MSLGAEKPPAPRSGDSDGASRSIKAASPRASLGDRIIALTQDLTVDSFVVKHERWVPLLIFLITAFTRFYRLDKPPGVVFDEHHFGRFTGQYLAGTYYFDIHPPLGKLVFYWVARAVGYDYKVCHYEKIDDPYAPDCKFYWLRATSALFGSATAPLVYYIARGFGGSVWAGILASMLFCFDGLNAGESRLILIDAQLIFWSAATLAAALVWWRRWNAHVDAEDEHRARVRLLTETGSSATTPAAAVASAPAAQQDSAPAAVGKRAAAGEQDGGAPEDTASADVPAAGDNSASTRSSAALNPLASPDKSASAAAESPAVTSPGGRGAKGKGKKGKAGGAAIDGAAYDDGAGNAATSAASAVSAAAVQDDQPKHQPAEAPAPASTGAAAMAAAPAQQQQQQAAMVPPPGSRVFVSHQALRALEHQLHADKRYMSFWVRIAWALAIGVICANCVSIKFTGLAAPGMVAVESFFAFFYLKRAYPLHDLLLIAATVFSVFAAYYKMHFDLLPLSGDGDEFMFYEFKRCLVGNSAYDPTAVKPGFWESFVYLNVDMVRANAGILERHNWDSVWWEWVLNLRGVLYYSVDVKHTYTEGVYLLGNPMAIWFLLGVVGVAVVLLALYARLRTDSSNNLSQRHGRFFGAAMYCLITYALNLAPYIAVRRSTFIYHYMPAMLMAQVLGGLLVDKLTPVAMKPAVVKLILLVVVSCYLYYSPWIYAFPLTSEGHARRRWLPRWD